MAGVSAAQVKALRERTGAGMMDCKKALVEVGGDLEAAVETMRKSGLAAADRKAGRIAAEGVIAIESDGSRGAMVEVNCETDFVAREDEFREFARGVARLVLADEPAEVEFLGTLRLAGGATVEDRRRALVARIGENIAVRRFEVLDAAGGSVAGYSHGGRIGVLVAVAARDDPAATGKDVAMHVAASRPLAVNESDLPADLVERERGDHRGPGGADRQAARDRGEDRRREAPEVCRRFDPARSAVRQGSGRYGSRVSCPPGRGGPPLRAVRGGRGNRAPRRRFRLRSHGPGPEERLTYDRILVKLERRGAARQGRVRYRSRGARVHRSGGREPDRGRHSVGHRHRWRQHLPGSGPRRVGDGPHDRRSHRHARHRDQRSRPPGFAGTPGDARAGDVGDPHQRGL